MALFVRFRRYVSAAAGVPRWVRRRRALPALAASGALLCLVSTLGACATKAPTIRVDAATIRDRSEDGTLVNLELALGNNNTGEIVLGEFEYTVTAGSTFVGRRRAGVTLAPLSTTKVILPAVLVGPPAANAEISDVRIVGELGWRGSTDLEKAFYLSGLRRPQQSFSDEATIE